MIENKNMIEKVIDSRCSDNKLNYIDKPCSFENNTTFLSACSFFLFQW